jgi:hypothetical protein
VAKNKRTSVYFDRETLKFVGIDESIKKQLLDTYKGIDVDSELNKMSLWLNSSKGKKRTGNIGFIMNWLSNASPIPQTISQSYDLIESDTPLGHLLQDYLEGLWKNREHILEFNTIRKKK